jgi:hypothetical protein
METVGENSLKEFVQRKIKNIQFVCEELRNTDTNPPNYPYDDFSYVMSNLETHDAPIDVAHTALDTMYFYKVQKFKPFSERFLLFLQFVKQHRDEGITDEQSKFYDDVFTIFANAGKRIPK